MGYACFLGARIEGCRSVNADTAQNGIDQVGGTVATDKHNGSKTIDDQPWPQEAKTRGKS